MAGSSEITDIIKSQIQRFEAKAESVDVGTVVEIGDGIARIHGLAGCRASEPAAAASARTPRRAARPWPAPRR